MNTLYFPTAHSNIDSEELGECTHPTSCARVHKSYSPETDETYCAVWCHGCGETNEEWYEVGNTTKEGM